MGDVDLLERHHMIWENYPPKTPTLSDELVTLREYGLGERQLILDIGEEDDGFIDRPDDTPQSVMRELSGHRARPTLKKGYSFAVVRNDTGESVGHMGVWLANVVLGKATIGYIVLKRHQRNGFAKHALKLASDWASELPYVARLELHIETWNTASIKAAEFAGYEQESLSRRYQTIDGYPRDMYLYVQFPELGPEFVDERELNA